jgi:spore coat protein Y
MEARENIGTFNNCVCNAVALINDLQEAVDNNWGCQKNFLGNENRLELGVLTRPFLLFTEDGDPFKAFFKSLDPEFDLEEDDDEDEDQEESSECFSPFFRVEKVDKEKCCAILRVLQPKDDFCEVIGYPEENLVATNSCITVDLNCFCAIQCLSDINLRWNYYM